MRPVPALVIALAVLGATASPAPAQEPDRSRTVEVDCSRRNASIARALTTQADELTVLISGFCREHVEIRRSNVTLRGASGDPALDGIQWAATDPAEPAVVEVWGSTDVAFEDLSVVGGDFNGLNVVDSPRVTMRNCRVVDNGFVGVFSTIGSSVYAERCDLSRNSSGARANRASRFACDGCSFVDNSSYALVAYEDGLIQLDGWWEDPGLAGSTPPDLPTTISGGLGVTSVSGSLVDLRYADLAMSTADRHGIAIGAYRDGAVEASLSTVAGTILVEAGSLWMYEVTQSSVGLTHNSVRSGGRLQLSATSLVGLLDVAGFSTALLEYGSVVDGDLSCRRGGDAWGELGSVTGAVSECSSWPTP